MEAKVTIITGQASKENIPLDLPTVIGRSREAGLTVAHPMISRRHAELFQVDGLLMIRDLGSLNGTKIGRQRIKESPLPPEAEFILGPFTFRVHYEYSGDLNALPPPVLDDKSADADAKPAKPWSDTPDIKATDDAPAAESPAKADDDFFNELFNDS
jgi:pSer/pThr/pTyr-binding forkhead associated (FHA) protein